MTDALAHLGPDDQGAWIDEPAGVALGFRRLSIVELSEIGHQPMLSLDGRFVLVFKGEIYNHADLRTELTDHVKSQDTGNSFRSLLWAITLEWRRDNESGAGLPNGVAIQGPPAGVRAVAQRSAHVPAFRDFPAGPLPVEATV